MERIRELETAADERRDKAGSESSEGSESDATEASSESSSKPYMISVANLTGKTIDVEVEATDTIAMVKDKIQEKDKACVVDQQTLSYNSTQLNDGKTLLDSQVQNLVSAMAGFAPPPVGQTSLTTAQQTTLAPVIAANWL
jgi:ubiquitin